MQEKLTREAKTMCVARKGFVLKEAAPGWTPEEVQALTKPRLRLAPDLQEIPP